MAAALADASTPTYDQGLGDFLDQSNNGSFYKGITKSHWKPGSFRSKCANRKCNKKLTFTNLYHHCRCCGDLFCSACTSYTRKLNSQANPDPTGKLYKVCVDCFEDGPQDIGQSRSHTSYFTAFRDVLRQTHSTKETHEGLTLRRDRKARVNVKEECGRLTQGFQLSIGSSSLSKILFDMTSTVTTPGWMRSPNWVFEKLCVTCTECSRGFIVGHPKRHCAICGSAVCKKCSSKNLLIYVPDGESNDNVQWAIIRIIGCPDKEPKVAIYLRTCKSCEKQLQDVQVAEHQQTLNDIAAELDTWPKVIEIYDTLTEIQAKIQLKLTKYQELVEALEITPGSARSLAASKTSNTQTLAKAQADISDHFTNFVTTFMALKKYKPQSDIQTVILRNIIKSKSDYYQENMFLFRECRNKLEEVTPCNVLESIQFFVNNNSLNSCYVCIKQLALEILHLCDKHGLPSDLPEQLADLENVILSDLQNAVKESGDSWEEHEEALNKLIKQQLKNHRLIQPSKRMLNRYGNQYLAVLLQNRCQEVLSKVELQFTDRSADRSYQKSKQHLNSFIQKQCSFDIECQDGWEVVSV